MRSNTESLQSYSANKRLVAECMIVNIEYVGVLNINSDGSNATGIHSFI